MPPLTTPTDALRHLLVTLGDRFEHAVADAPPAFAAFAAGATYDSRRGMVVVFGGLGGDGNLGDTWGFDGTRWTKLSDSGPEARSMGHLAYDARRERIVLFGGRTSYPDGDKNDTWEFDGTQWRAVTP